MGLLPQVAHAYLSAAAAQEMDSGDDNDTVAQVAALLGENGVAYLPQLLELIDAEEEAAMSAGGAGGGRAAPRAAPRP